MSEHGAIFQKTMSGANIIQDSVPSRGSIPINNESITDYLRSIKESNYKPKINRQS